MSYLRLVIAPLLGLSIGLSLPFATGCKDDASDGKSAAEPKESASATQATVGVPATDDALANLVRAVLADVRAGHDARARQILEQLALEEPEDFFNSHFPMATAKRLLADYRAQAPHLGELVAVLRANLDQGRDQVYVEHFDHVDDPKAIGFQNAALREMTNVTPLFSVRLHGSTKEPGFHLWSFVHDGNSFRWVGKLGAVRANIDPDTSRRLELRLEDAERIVSD